ncbi:MAG: hypothetical protein ACRD0Q_00310 [Acidimicrobiales bacterium]
MALWVETVDGRFNLEAEQTAFTFGRDPRCSFCLDESDLNIPRWAGSIGWREGRWILTNTSDSPPT